MVVPSCSNQGDNCPTASRLHVARWAWPSSAPALPRLTSESKQPSPESQRREESSTSSRLPSLRRRKRVPASSTTSRTKKGVCATSTSALCGPWTTQYCPSRFRRSWEAKNVQIPGCSIRSPRNHHRPCPSKDRRPPTKNRAGMAWRLSGPWGSKGGRSEPFAPSCSDFTCVSFILLSCLLGILLMLDV